MSETTKTTTLDDLLEQERELQAKIKRFKEEETASAIKQIKELMARYGITTKELEVATKKASGDKPRKPVAIKFKNPETGATWTGRGVMPTWLRAAPDAEIFRVKSE